MKHRILKKFVKAYRPYGTSRKGSLVRWWTRKRQKQRNYVRKHHGTVILI